jgi:MFS family permease
MAAAFIGPFGGYLSDKVAKRRPLMILCSLSMLLSLIIYPYLDQDLFLPNSIFFGLSGAFITPLIFALPEELMGIGKGAIGFGVLGMFATIGFILGPMLIGIIMDISNSFTYSFLLLAFFNFMAIVTIFFLKSR